MNIKKLLANKPKSIQTALKPEVLARWNNQVLAESDDTTISIYEIIGEDFWTGEGMTAKRMSGILRSIGDKPVTVMINSPGGDVFEGIAIYNILKEHKQHVTVKVVGLAASAASVIAMAGDTIEIGKSAFFMIHNAWTCACGNRHDMREVADFLEPFDAVMAEVYADKTGQTVGDVVQMMDDETFINGSDSVKLGFANSLLGDEQIAEDSSADSKALRADKLIDTLMAKAGIPRSERRQLKKDYAGTHNAADDGTPSAAYEPNEPLPLLDFNFNL